MELWVLDESFNTVMIISQFNISWTKRWYDIGEFYLSIIDTYSETTAGILNPTKVRYIFRRDSNYIGRIDNIIYEDGLININGKFLENMLNFRTDYDYVNYRGTLEDVAFQIVNNNSIINKPIAYLVLGENKNKGSYINASIFGKKIGEYLYTLSDIYENSYNIKYDPLQHKIVFNVLWGLDRTQQQTINEWCLFGQQWGNVYSESYETNTDYANYAIVLGEGEGVSRKKLIIDLRKSDEELREILVDARDLQSNDLTNEEYEDKLRQKVKDLKYIKESNHMDFFRKKDSTLGSSLEKIKEERKNKQIQRSIEDEKKKKVSTKVMTDYEKQKYSGFIYKK